MRCAMVSHRVSYRKMAEGMSAAGVPVSETALHLTVIRGSITVARALAALETVGLTLQVVTKHE